MVGAMLWPAALPLTALRPARSRPAAQLDCTGTLLSMARLLDHILPGTLCPLRCDPLAPGPSMSAPAELFPSAGHHMTLLPHVPPFSSPSGFMNENLEFPGQMWAFLSDGIGIVCGSMMGTTPLTVYIESAAGESA